MPDFDTLLEAIKELNKIETPISTLCEDTKWRDNLNPDQLRQNKAGYNAKYNKTASDIDNSPNNPAYIKVPLHNNPNTRNVNIKTLNSKSLPPFEDSLFHYTKSPSSLLSILSLGSIYTTPSVNDTQADINIKNRADLSDYKYACFTNHPSKVAFEYERPFGIEFSRQGLEQIANQMSPRGILLDYHQVKAKAASTVTSDSGDIVSQHGMNKNYNDTFIAGVGKYKNGEAFLCLQTWAPRMIDDDLYEEIVDWMVKNNTNKEESGNSSELLYFNTNNRHDLFAANSSDSEAAQYLKSHDLYRHYLTDTEKLKFDNFRQLEVKEGRKAKPEFNFKCSHEFVNLDTNVSNSFKSEIAELYTYSGINGIIPSIPNQIHNTKAPKFIDILNEIEVDTDPNSSELLLSKQTLEKLYRVFNEYETRMYVPADSIKFTFAYRNIIKAIWLPDIYYDKDVSTKCPIFLRQILSRAFELFRKKKMVDTAALSQACSEVNLHDNDYQARVLLPLLQKVIMNQVNRKVIYYAYEDGSNFIDSSIHNEIIDSRVDSNTSITNRDYTRYMTKDQKVSTNNVNLSIQGLQDIINGTVYPETIVYGKSSDADITKMLNDDKSNMFILIGKNNLQSLIAKNFQKLESDDKVTTAHARVGAQGLIFRYRSLVGADQARYMNSKILAAKSLDDIPSWKERIEVLFIRKSDGFLELPGGGFEKKPVDTKDALIMAQNKLKSETGLSMDNLFDTGEGLYLYEGNSMRDIYKNVPALARYSMSYYQLYAAINYQIGKYADRNINKDSVWIPFCNLSNIKDITKRYANIINFAEELLKEKGLDTIKELVATRSVNTRDADKNDSDTRKYTSVSYALDVINNNKEIINQYINSELGIKTIEMILADIIDLYKNKVLSKTNKVLSKTAKIALRVGCIRKLCSLSNQEFKEKAAKIIDKSTEELRNALPKYHQEMSTAGRGKSIILKLSELSQELKKSA